MFPLNIANKCKFKDTRYFLEGASSITKYYSKEHDKTIYIFGNIHNMDGLCVRDGPIIKVPDLIEKMITDNKNKLIDVFLERHHRLDHKDIFTLGNKKDSYLKHAVIKFGNYNKCTNCRFHSADSRNHLITYLHFFLISKKIVSERAKLKQMIIDNSYGDINKITDTLAILKNTISEISFVDTDEKSIYEKSKIAKQYNNIKDPNVRKILDEFKTVKLTSLQKIKDSILEIIKTLNTIIKVSDNPKLNKSESLQILRTTFEPLIDIASKTTICHIMDLYLLARLFRSYKNAPDAKYVIIYVGENHAETYKIALSKLGFTISFHRKSPPKFNNCIDITGLNLMSFR